MYTNSEKELIKTTLKYRVVAGHAPRANGVVRRPQVVSKGCCNEKALINYALDMGYVRGRSEDISGILGGLFQAMQAMCLEGYTVYLKDILRIRGYLTGTVDESGKLTEKNEYCIRTTAFKDLKCRASDFNWECVDSKGNPVPPNKPA